MHHLEFICSMNCPFKEIRQFTNMQSLFSLGSFSCLPLTKLMATVLIFTILKSKVTTYSYALHTEKFN